MQSLLFPKKRSGFHSHVPSSRGPYFSEKWFRSELLQNGLRHYLELGITPSSARGPDTAVLRTFHGVSSRFSRTWRQVGPFRKRPETKADLQN